MMRQMPMRNIRGLGRKLGEEVFRATGAQMAADLQRFTQEQMVQRFGERTGHWLYWVCRGVDDEEVKCNLRPKSLLAFKSFSPVKTFDELQPWLRLLCEELVHRIAADRERLQRFPKTLVVFHRGRSADGGQFSRSLSVSRSTAMPGAARQQTPSAGDVFEAAMSVLLRLDSIFPCTRIAIGATDMHDLVPEKGKLEALFAKQASAVLSEPAVVTVAGERSGEAHRADQEAVERGNASETAEADDTAQELRCPRCNEQFTTSDELAVHTDWHTALDLQRQFDAQTAHVSPAHTARSADKRPQSSGSQRQEKTSPKKARATLDWYYKKS